jgi:ArsR family transcriptional regulator
VKIELEEKKKLLSHKAEVLKALAHPARLCIISCLMQTNGCNVTELQRQLKLPQSTMSQHVSKLKSQGIIAGERNGVEINYHIVDPEISEMMEHYLKDLFIILEREDPK